MKLAIIARFAAIALLGATTSVAHAAEPIVLKFAYPGPLTSTPATKGVQPWAAKILAETDGLIDIKLYTGIASYANIYDRVLNEVVDFGFGTFGTIEDQFPGSSITGLPFTTENSVEAGLALWRLYASGVLAEEYRRVKPIAMFGFGTSVLYLTRPLAKFDDLKGMKIFANGRSVARIVSLIGIVPITSNPGALHDGLSRNLAAGSVYSWSGIEQFKLAELLRASVDLPFGRPGGWFFMNKEAFAKLPDKGQRAIDKFSGEEPSAGIGRELDRLDDEARARIAGDPAKFQDIRLTAAEINNLRQVLAPMITEWVANVPNGANILAAFNQEVARIRKP
jgi:TRAP-type C4-dicarboxylate transport system substrate-binding protein